MKTNPNAGKVPSSEQLIDISKLIKAYYDGKPDPKVPSHRISFGTSGHRGSSFNLSFNEQHILAITQAICLYRSRNSINGPLFLGIDTHALSKPAYETALEVLAANNVQVMVAPEGEFTPTPAVSHAILTYNRGRTSGFADGIVISPSHNPPQDGGFKYNPPNGGPADSTATGWIQNCANEFLENSLKGVKRIPLSSALTSSCVTRYDYIEKYVADLSNVIDFDPIRSSGLNLGVDPLGGAGVNYWDRIGEHYKINLSVVNKAVDPTFRFMTLDWDGQIRMDPSSIYAMQSLVALKDRFDLAVACDTDHDRHGIVTRSVGLMPTNHFLSVCVYYLFKNRPAWKSTVAIGKTAVTTALIDRIAASLGRKVFEVPVGFKWFVEGLVSGDLGFTGEESAGASFLRKDGTVWTTDKDGLIAALLAAEITAKSGKDPGEVYQSLTTQFGEPFFERIDSPASPEQKKVLSAILPEQVKAKELAGEKILSVITRTSGNNAPLSGVKLICENGWFAARPSGTENFYKVYAESFVSKEHLSHLLSEGQEIVNKSIA